MCVMKKQPMSVLAIFLMAMIGLSACQKPAPAEQPVASETATTTAPATEAHDHDHDDHDHDEHDDHDHEGHDHDHAHSGETYQCGDKKINILVHDHEGEKEAHALIDDIEYDLHPDATKPNYYVAQEEGLNNQGMSMTIDADKAVFAGLDGKPLLDCQKVVQ